MSSSNCGAATVWHSWNRMFDAFISFAFPFRFYVDQRRRRTSGGYKVASPPRPIVGPCDPKISACCMGLGPVDIKRSVNSLYSPSPSPSQGRQNNKTLEKHLLISCAHHQRGGSGQRATKNGSKNERKLKRGKKKSNAIMRTLNEVIHSLHSTFAHARMRDGNDDLSRRFMCISNCRGGSSIYAILSLFICKKVWEI